MIHRKGMSGMLIGMACGQADSPDRHVTCGRVTHWNGTQRMRVGVTHRTGMLGMSRMLELTRFL